MTIKNFVNYCGTFCPPRLTRSTNAVTAARPWQFITNIVPNGFLMDWQMPDTDLLTANRQIIAKYPNANICLVTSYDDEVLRIEAREAGASKFVLKKDLAELPGILIGEQCNPHSRLKLRLIVHRLDHD